MLGRTSATAPRRRLAVPIPDAERLAAVAGPLAWLALAAFAVTLTVVYATQPQYDSLYSLLWGDELVSGRVPGVDGYRAPTEHPLLLAVSVVLGPLGETGGRLLVGLCALSVVALAMAAFRLGRVAGGVVCGVLAAALIATRLNLWLLASIGFLDLPYIALVGWAAALEAERPRRGGPVWVLLALAGLLRPEAWVLAALYALWVGWPDRLRGLVRAGALAAIAPVTWMAVDLALTGQPLFSLTHTDALALELQRERPFGELPGLMFRLLEEVVKAPVLYGAGVGAAAALALRRRALAVPAALVVVTCATYFVIASGGLPNVYRYLLNAGTGLVVLAAFGLAGWTQLPRASVWRVRWMVPALVVLVAGAVWTVAKTSPAKARVVLSERVALRDDLEAIVTAPAVERLRACGTFTTPNHKLIPEIRQILGLPAGAVLARSDRSRPAQTRGVALVIDKRLERLPALDVGEVPRDGGATVLQVPPPGFRLVADNASFALWGRC